MHCSSLLMIYLRWKRAFFICISCYSCCYSFMCLCNQILSMFHPYFVFICKSLSSIWTLWISVHINIYSIIFSLILSFSWYSICWRLTLIRWCLSMLSLWYLRWLLFSIKINIFNINSTKRIIIILMNTILFHLTFLFL